MNRLALDHVLALVAGDPCGDSLVLRGSMAMLAWFGDRAREPGDIDWVVRPSALTAVDEDDPYVETLHAVRMWPEVAHGVPRGAMWDFDDFDTGGLRAHLPPEGLHWVLDTRAEDRPHETVAELIRAHPEAGNGLVLDGESLVEDSTWGYAYEGGGTRLRVPWRSGSAEGEIQLDFAYDEALPEPPILIAVPRVGVTTPTVVWAASRRQALAWKLTWLRADEPKQAKDIYDAELLAEGLRGGHIDPPDGDLGPWLDRLVAALER